MNLRKLSTHLFLIVALCFAHMLAGQALCKAWPRSDGPGPAFRISPAAIRNPVMIASWYTVPQGTLTGSSVCAGETGTLTFTATAGTGPFTLTYSDGLNTFTANNVQSGIPFPVSGSPVSTTTYSLSSITDATGSQATGLSGITATIILNNCNLCTGSLGDPVVYITFGSGNNPGPSLPSAVPGASTSMQYVAVSGNPAQPTPVDGQYTLTNVVPYNPNWFYGATDHTPGDVNGYMAFYNASENPGEFYDQAVSDLCGGTTYEFAAWIGNALNPATLNGEKPNITFRIEKTDGSLLGSYNTGDIPQTSSFTWKQYGFNFTTPAGVSTVVLKMINNNPGGNNNVGNDLAIDDITFRPCGAEISTSFDATAPSDSIAVCPATAVTLYGTISAGYVSPSYLWQVSSDNGNSWTDISNSNSLQIDVTAPSPAVRQDYLYRLLAGEGTNIDAANCRVASNRLTLTILTPARPDFSFDQDVCNPLQMTFSVANQGTASYNYSWDFGDGNQGGNDPNPLHDFTDYSTYDVKLTITSPEGCRNSILKTVPVRVENSDLIITPNSTICRGDSLQFDTKPVLAFCWSPATYLDDPSKPAPKAGPPVTTTYYFTAKTEGSNLVVNGDFSAGNSGFSSDYQYSSSGLPAAVYTAGTNPQAWNPGMAACGDHTTGSGNMMLVNGSQQTGVKVWSETISVQPNTNYAFSAWLETITTVSPARLQFSINGALLDNIFQANASPCVWDRFYSVWNSGNSTSATISIVNMNQDFSGNDFALDDISFSPLKIERDSVTVEVNDCPGRITGVINAYAAALSYDRCTNSLGVDNAADFNVGDTVLLIQMKGAVIDTTNSASFGSLPDYKDAGNYEYNYVDGKNGNNLVLKNRLTHGYDIPNGKVQLIRVPYYQSATVAYTLTCQPWNGSTGGVLALNVKDSLTLHADIDVSGKGFRGGTKGNNLTNGANCGQTGYRFSPNSPLGAMKGEGIATIYNMKGRGALANGGGGGDDHNSGGGGGGNGGAGGQGGYQYEHCTSNSMQFDNGGKPGHAMAYSGTTQKICMGGGGGSGHANNSAGFNPDGGNGGGIVLIRTSTLLADNNASIKADGDDGLSCSSNSTNDNCNEGMGGGGAGGSILLQSDRYINPVSISAKGGNGANVDYYVPNDAAYSSRKHGPGGGGGGGMVWLSQPAPVSGISSGLTGGTNGVNSFYGKDPWGAAAGNTGITLFDLVLSEDTILFDNRIYLTEPATPPDTAICAGDTVQLNADNGNTYLYSWSPVASLDDPSSPTPKAAPKNTTPYMVDISDPQCLTDTTLQLSIHVNQLPDISIAGTIPFCKEAQLSAAIISQDAPIDDWTWDFGDSHTAANASSVLHGYEQAGSYTVRLVATDDNHCLDSAFATVQIDTIKAVTNADTLVCPNTPVYLQGSGGTIYNWSPARLVSDPTQPDPVARTPVTTWFYLTVKNDIGCENTDSVLVMVIPRPAYKAPPDKEVCKGSSIVLEGNNGDTYLYTWSPGTYLDDPHSPRPQATPDTSIRYTVLIDEPTCRFDTSFTVNLTVHPIPSVTVGKRNDIDCLNPTSPLYAGGADSYLWYPPWGVDDAHKQNPLASVDSTTTFTVTGTNQYGCTASDSIQVIVTRGGVPLFAVPNAFTPNGDGENDCFGIKRWGNVEIEEFSVYSRWGQLLFTTKNPRDCWDGRFKGNPMPAGGYVYVIKARSFCGPVTRKGMVLLLR